ncbi:MAG: MFS transporter [Candidatus Hodarchaeales archaeon]
MSQFLNSSSNSTVDPFLPIFARNLGATPVDVGLLAGIFSLVSISQLLWARFAERAQKHRSLVFLGRLMAALLYLPMMLLKQGQILVLLALRFLQGIFVSATAPTETSLMNEHIPLEKRTKILPWFTQLGLIGVILGNGFWHSLCVDGSAWYGKLFIASYCHSFGPCSSFKPRKPYPPEYQCSLPIGVVCEN